MGTMILGWPRRVPWRLCAAARPGFKAPSTVWASARETPTSAKWLWRLRCLYGVPVDMNLTKIREVSGLVRRAARHELEPWKPVVGENLFMRESGAVASQFHIPEAIEPFSADLVGATRAIVLGKKSGLDSIAIKAKELGIVAYH